ncbi:MAG: hypothetical protein KatS3mg102_0357 [Planctomycetota bacterium]|nr:MAG: hypothetical protein KatS3mg102_0357 [Planctomycetota bacterium]
MAGLHQVCVHAHFYQPPRDNPWLEAVEREETAAPARDWNRRVHEECYAPNGWARILGPTGRIARIVSNYERLSFDVGPTLLSWLEREAPRTYARVLEADRRAAARHGGHGPALAQAYGHAILPLCEPRDLRTQVRWGLADFRHRFGREPAGMWLPECAVDLPVLQELVAAGVRFVVLAPHQAAAVRPGPAAPWRRVEPGTLDTTVPYRQRLPGAGEPSIAVFFYDGELAHRIAFGELLQDGARLLRALLDGSRPAGSEGGGAPPPLRLVHAACWQGCRADLMRNALAHVPKRSQPMSCATLKTVFAQPS